MPNNKRRTSARPARSRTSKLYWLPMPLRDAQAIVLQYRLAIEALRGGRAGQVEAQCVAHAVLLTSMLTELGYGRLDPALIRDAEHDVLELLERGNTSGVWRFPEAHLPRLIDIVNEHDRQMREVHLAALIACNERLDRLLSSDKNASRGKTH